MEKSKIDTLIDNVLKPLQGQTIAIAKDVLRFATEKIDKVTKVRSIENVENEEVKKSV